MHPRSQIPRIDPQHWYAQGLVYALLGGGSPTLLCRDAGPFGLLGTLTNMDPATDWVFNGELNRWCLEFDGTDDYVSIPATAALNGTHFTASAWVWWINAGTTYARIVDRVYNGQFGMYVGEASRVLGASLSTTGGNFDGTISSANSIPESNTAWVHVAATYNGDKLTSYINGAIDTVTEANNGVLNASTSIMCVGQRADAGGNRQIEGKLTDVCVWNRALSSLEILPLANKFNTHLSGLILSDAEEVWPVVSAAAGLGYSPWIHGLTHMNGGFA